MHRGGSYLCTEQYCTRYMIGTRGRGETSSGSDHVGFRLVKDAKGGEPPHLKLTRSAPAAGSILDASPARLQLWFSEEPLLPLTGITLTGQSGAVKLGARRAGSEQSLVVSVDTALEPGQSRIAWKTAGDDGHVVQGAVDFSVKAATRPPK